MCFCSYDELHNLWSIICLILHCLQPKMLYDISSVTINTFAWNWFCISNGHFTCVSEICLESPIVVHHIPSIFLLKSENLCHALISAMVDILHNCPLVAVALQVVGCGNKVLKWTICESNKICGGGQLRLNGNKCEDNGHVREGKEKKKERNLHAFTRNCCWGNLMEKKRHMLLEEAKDVKGEMGWCKQLLCFIL